MSKFSPLPTLGAQHFFSRNSLRNQLFHHVCLQFTISPKTALSYKACPKEVYLLFQLVTFQKNRQMNLVPDHQFPNTVFLLKGFTVVKYKVVSWSQTLNFRECLLEPSFFACASPLPQPPSALLPQQSLSTEKVGSTWYPFSFSYYLLQFLVVYHSHRW